MVGAVSFGYWLNQYHGAILARKITTTYLVHHAFIAFLY